MGLITQFVSQPSVVIEVDPGIDDGLALMVMLGAWKLGLIRILAVICSNGNVDLKQSCENTKKVMDAAHIKGFQIPLFYGVETAVYENLPKDFFFGQDGFGDINPPIKTKPRTIYPAIHLAEYLTINQKEKNEISYLSLGSLTFLMTFLLQQPDFKFKDVWIMGGNNLGVDHQEWNFHVDPEAVHFILRQSTKMPLYIGTFQNCENVRPTVGWRRNILGKIPTDIVRLLNKAEASKLQNKRDDEIWLQYDPIVAVAFVSPESIINMKEVNVNVTLGTDPKTRSVLTKGNFPVKFIENLDLDKYKNLFEKTAKALTGLNKVFKP